MKDSTLFVVRDGKVCISLNGKWVDARELRARIVAKYGEAACDEPGGAAMLIRLTDAQLDEFRDKTPPETVDIPDERREPADWQEVPQWARCYIEGLEDALGVQERLPGAWD